MPLQEPGVNSLLITAFLLASIMSGEASILGDGAALAVGHVALNRGGVEGFNGFHSDPDPRYVLLAEQVLSGEDPTGGCLYILSFQDVRVLWGDDAACIRQLADWQSELRTVDGTPYRLYAYKEWPVGGAYEAPLCDPRW